MCDCVTGWAYYGCYLYELYIKEQTGADWRRHFCGTVPCHRLWWAKETGKDALDEVTDNPAQSQMLRTLRVAAAVFLAFAA